MPGIADILRDQAEDEHCTSTPFDTNHGCLISKQERRQKGVKEQQREPKRGNSRRTLIRIQGHIWACKVSVKYAVKSNGNYMENHSLVTNRTWLQLMCYTPQDHGILISAYRGMEVWRYGGTEIINKSTPVLQALPRAYKGQND